MPDPSQKSSGWSPLAEGRGRQERLGDRPLVAEDLGCECIDDWNTRNE